jgi:hypothetical protein
MKIIASCVVTAIALLAGGVSAHAAEAAKANVTRVYTDTVDPAHQQAYETGVKNYNKCLGEHGLKYAWLAWGHETGNTYMYSFAAGPYAWADFDTMHVVAKPCDDTWRAQANPHLKGETSAFLIEMPELSRMPADKGAKPALINVTFFTLKGDRGADDAFTDGLKKIVAAAEKTKWTGHYILYKTKGADKDAPDYLILSPYKDWAAYGAGADPGVWKMLENADGKDNAEAVRKSINDAIQDVSSHVDNYNEDLTYTPAKK